MTNPIYLKQYDTDITDKIALYNKLCEQTNPNINELKIYLDDIPIHKQTLGGQAFKLKYLAMTTIPTTIEKTMTPYQLYVSNNPLWTVELSKLQIESFLDIEKNTGKLSEELFKRTYAYETNQNYIDIETFDSPYIQSITKIRKELKL